MHWFLAVVFQYNSGTSTTVFRAGVLIAYDVTFILQCWFRPYSRPNRVLVRNIRDSTSTSPPRQAGTLAASAPARPGLTLGVSPPQHGRTIEWLPPPASKHIGWSRGWIWGWSGTPAWILGWSRIGEASEPSLLCSATLWSQRVRTQQTHGRGSAGRELGIFLCGSEGTVACFRTSAWTTTRIFSYVSLSSFAPVASILSLPCHNTFCFWSGIAMDSPSAQGVSCLCP